MALVDNAWYVNYGNGSSTGYYAVATFPASTTVAAGALYRQLTAPAVGNERVFVVTTGGLTTSEPTWTVTRGALNTSGAAVFQEATGLAGLNGDITNAPRWSTSQTWVLGQHIYDPGTASIQMCTVAGAGKTSGSPTFSATAGVTATDASATWTSVGLASSFSIWKAPHARFQAAYAANWGQATNAFFASAIHAETQSANMTLTAPGGTSALPVQVYCVLQSPGSVPPGPSDITTGASISTTGSGTMTVQAGGVYNGFAFNCGSGANSPILKFMPNGIFMKLMNCSANKLSTNANADGIEVSGNANNDTLVWDNVTVSFGNTGDGITPLTGINFTWRNTTSAIQGSTIPGAILYNNSGFITPPGPVVFEGVDFSGAGSNTIFGNAISSSVNLLKNCKVPSGGIVSAVGNANFGPGGRLDVINSDSGATNYVHGRYAFGGQHNQNTTIYRSGGASDGTTAVSWQIISSSPVNWLEPFECLTIPEWNTLTGSTRTITVYGLINSAAVPSNDQIWLECEYLGSSGSPLGSFANNTKATNLSTGSALTADSTSSWTAGVAARQNSHAYVVGNTISVPDNTGRVFFCTGNGTTAGSEPGGYASAVDGGSVTDGTATFRAGCRFSMAVTLTAQMVGYIYGTVKVALPSTTFWVDPLLNQS